MVLAKGTSIGGTKGSGYVHGMSCISMIDPHPQKIGDKNGRFLVEKSVAAAKEKKEESEVAALNTCSSSSTSSSIGKNSDISGRSKENSGDADEVQSSYKGPLDAMEALEEVLPIRRGISNFYNGKSKSFACLADAASTSSIKQLAKPENAHIRRRRNLLASSLVLDNKNRSSPLKSNSAGVSKRAATNPSRSTLALAVTMSSSSVNGNNETHSFSTAVLGSLPSSVLRARIHSQLRDYYQYQSTGSSPSPPVSPRMNFPAWRSLSLADLQHCVSISPACTAPTPTQSDTDGSQIQSHTQFYS